MAAEDRFYLTLGKVLNRFKLSCWHFRNRSCSEVMCSMKHVFFINRYDAIFCRYRAKIEKIEGSKITVFFIDFGNVS